MVKWQEARIELAIQNPSIPSKMAAPICALAFTGVLVVDTFLHRPDGALAAFGRGRSGLPCPEGPSRTKRLGRCIREMIRPAGRQCRLGQGGAS